MILNRIIHNEKLCKPLELTPEQIAEAKKIQQKEQEEKLIKEKELQNKENLGLGDLVAKVAQPIAKGIDSIAGTDIQNCGGCKKRQEALNNLIPDIGLKKNK